MSPPAAPSARPPSTTTTRAVKIPHHTSHQSHPSTSSRRRGGQNSKIPAPVDALPTTSTTTSSESSYSSNSPFTHPTSHDPASPISAQQKGKSKATPSSHGPPTISGSSWSSLGPSMSPSQSHSYRSINLNANDDPDEPPRLITYTKSGQGFTWNEELFLPSYMVGRRRRTGDWDDNGGEEVEVVEVFVTDEEVAAMMP